MARTKRTYRRSLSLEGTFLPPIVGLPPPIQADTDEDSGEPESSSEEDNDSDSGEPAPITIDEVDDEEQKEEEEKAEKVEVRVGSKILEMSCLKTSLAAEEGEIIEIDSPNRKRSEIMVNHDEDEEYIFQENIIGSFLQQEMNAIDSTIESKKTAGKPVETTTPQKKRDHAGEPVISPQETSFGEPELFSGQPPGKPEASPHLPPKKNNQQQPPGKPDASANLQKKKNPVRPPGEPDASPNLHPKKSNQVDHP